VWERWDILVMPVSLCAQVAADRHLLVREEELQRYALSEWLSSRSGPTDALSCPDLPPGMHAEVRAWYAVRER
jgi:hypothetical protein